MLLAIREWQPIGKFRYDLLEPLLAAVHESDERNMSENDKGGHENRNIRKNPAVEKMFINRSFRDFLGSWLKCMKIYTKIYENRKLSILQEK